MTAVEWAAAPVSRQAEIVLALTAAAVGACVGVGLLALWVVGHS